MTGVRVRVRVIVRVRGRVRIWVVCFTRPLDLRKKCMA